MTILTACQEAAVELNQAQPASLFSTTDTFAVELRRQANKAARDIGQYYEWQNLTALHTMVGDGVTTSFPLPSNYDRMPKKQHVQTSQFSGPLYKAEDLDDWLDMQINTPNLQPGKWIILGNAMQFSSAPATGNSPKFYYIKNTVVTGAASAQQTAFLADTDTFNLSENLLTLAIIWRWRAMKRQEYSEDLRNYEIALSEEVAKDKGSRTLVVGAQRLPLNISVAYPRALG